MGADRKGPLAAFIVVAIIAAILLITSVRSQAATGWLDSALPSTPEVVDRIGGGLDQVVEQGAVLVRRTTGLSSASPTHDAIAPRDPSDPAALPSQPAAVQPTGPAFGQSSPTRQGGAPPSHSVRPPAGHQGRTTPGPGRHRGWSHAAHGYPAHTRPDAGRHGHGRHLGRRRHHH